MVAFGACRDRIIHRGDQLSNCGVVVLKAKLGASCNHKAHQSVIFCIPMHFDEAMRSWSAQLTCDHSGGVAQSCLQFGWA
jgi:hypothetical protein